MQNRPATSSNPQFSTDTVSRTLAPCHTPQAHSFSTSPAAWIQHHQSEWASRRCQPHSGKHEPRKETKISLSCPQHALKCFSSLILYTGLQSGAREKERISHACRLSGKFTMCPDTVHMQPRSRASWKSPSRPHSLAPTQAPQAKGRQT